jgi:hypothetical protein
VTRSRGKSSKTLVNRWFPHKVTLPAENVSGQNTWNISLFYSQLGVGFENQHNTLLRKDDRDYYVYSFDDPQHAAQFQALFGGELAIAKPRPSSDPYDFS